MITQTFRVFDEWLHNQVHNTLGAHAMVDWWIEDDDLILITEADDGVQSRHLYTMEYLWTTR